MIRIEDRPCLFCRNHASRQIGNLFTCDRLECQDKANSSFDSLPIGAHFRIASWDYNITGEWIKLSIIGIPNPAYPNLSCNAERVVKTGKGHFAPGDRDYEWVMATMETERI